MLAPSSSLERLVADLDWNLLFTFLVIAESQSISEAAVRLGRKQPTVSAALKRLESALGRRLIDRAPGQFRLTEAGEVLRGQAEEINAQMLRMATVMREITDEVSGRVTIAVASHVICPLFDETLTAFHQRHPRASVAISVRSSRDTISAVASGRASLAICIVRERSPKLEYLRLYREFFGLFCGPPHPLFARDDVQLSDMSGLPMVSFDTDHIQDVLRPVTLLRLEADLGQHIAGVSSALEEVRRMILTGMGYGPLPLHVAAPDVEAGRLRQLPPLKSLPTVDVDVVWNPRATMNRAEAAFLDMLRTRIAATPIEQRTYGPD